MTAIKQICKTLGLDGDERDAAHVLLVSAEVGPRASAIAAKTGLSLKRVHEFGRRFKANGIWKKGFVFASDWKDPDSGGVAFCMDVMVGTGKLRRLP